MVESPGSMKGKVEQKLAAIEKKSGSPETGTPVVSGGLKVSREMMRALTPPPSSGDAYALVVDLAMGMVGPDAAFLMLPEEDGPDLITVSCRGLSGRITRKLKVSPGEGFSGWVARTGRPLIVNDLCRDRRFSRYARTLEFQAGAAMVIPVRVGGRTRGVLNFINRETRPFTGDDRRIGEILAGFAGLALEREGLAGKFQAADVELKEARARLRKYDRDLEASRSKLEKGRQRLQDKVSLKESQLAEKAKRLSILYEVGRALSSTLELDSLLDLIVRLAARHLKSRKASLMLIEEGLGQMRINSSVGIRKWIVEKARIRLGEGPAGTVAATGEAILIKDIATDRRFRRPSRGTYQTGSFLSVPLKRQDNILGVLNIADKRSRVPFDQDDLNLTLTLAAEAAIAVENAKLYLDIKEKMLSLEELYRSRETERRQLLTLINSITDAILAVDLERRPLFINRKARSLLRIPEEEGEHLMKDLLEPGDLSRAIIEGMESAFSPASTSREVTLEKTPSGRRHYEIVSLPIWEKEGDLIGVLSIVRDITEFKELDRIRSDFLTHASHQLKTPVGLIQGFSDTLVKHADMEEDRRRHFLKLIHSEASRLGSLIENLLDFTRLESKTLPVEMERVRVDAALEELLPAIRGKAEEKGIRFNTRLESHLPVIETDKKCLMEVLQNILDNSLKFTPRGGKITIGVSQGKSRLELMVSDTGAGIEEGDLPHIFDKFYVGRATGRPGTGLGLYLAKEIIDSVGGSITVTSREGKGTTVKILLPAGECVPVEDHGGSR